MGRINTFIRNINYLTKNSLWDQRESDIVYLSEKIIDDTMYQLDYRPNLMNKPVILNKEESLELIRKCPKSNARFGDGEIKIMMGMNQPFQHYDKRLADRMKAMLKNERDDMYICLNSGYYHMWEPDTNSSGSYYLRNGYDFRRFFDKFISYDRIYLTSHWTDLWLEHSEKNNAYVNNVHNLFEDKDVLLIVGKGVLDKLTYDVFDKAKSKQVILGPLKHAFDEYDSIKEKIIKTASKEQMICIILGMTSRVMAEDLTDNGFIAYDVGHLAKYYDAYMKGLPRNDKNVKEFFAPD